jgi:hypothetical protein
VLAKTVVGTDGMTTREVHRQQMDHLQAFLDSIGASPALQERVFYKTALRILGMDEELKKHYKAVAATAGDVDMDAALAGRCRITPMSDFVDVQGEPAAHQTLAYIGYDTHTLHATFICRDSNPGKLAATTGGPVGEIWQDDSIEMFIAPTPDHYWHVVVNSIGRAFIGRGRGEGVALPTTVIHKVAKDAWAVQLEVPFNLLGSVPTPKSRWGLNVSRNKISPPSQTITWMEIASTFHDPASFGYLDFE